MHVEDNFPTAADILDIPIEKFITLSENSCGYSSTYEEMIVNYIHNLLLNTKAAESWEDNNNWCEAIDGQFAKDYWEAMRV